MFDTRKNSKKLKAGIIGIGEWGERYIPLLNKNPFYELVRCYDTNIDKLTSYSKKFGFIPSYDENSFFSSNDIDIVFILVPNHLHKYYIQKALKKHLLIYVEKPLADNLHASNEVLNLRNKYNGKIYVGHSLKYNYAFIKIKELIDAKLIGEINYFVCIRSVMRKDQDSQTWRNNPNFCQLRPLTQLGIHFIDIIRDYFGEIIDVCSYSSTKLTNDSLMDASAVLIKCNSSFGVLLSSYATINEMKLLIYGKKGKIEYNGSKKIIYTSLAGKTKILKIKLNDEIKDELVDLYNHFVFNRHTKNTLENAYENMQVLDLIKRVEEKGAKE